MTATPQDARSRAEEFIDDPVLLRDPVAVRDSRGAIVSWFVPIVSGERLTGFVELLPDLSLRRTSRFAAAAAPLAAAWLDAETVRERAATILGEDETAGEPYLSFDGALDRLAWAVPMRGAGRSGMVFVAGDAVWRGPEGESTGS